MKTNIVEKINTLDQYNLKISDGSNNNLENKDLILSCMEILKRGQYESLPSMNV
jgi:hypothetical protein